MKLGYHVLSLCLRIKQTKCWWPQQNSNLPLIQGWFVVHRRKPYYCAYYRFLLSFQGTENLSPTMSSFSLSEMCCLAVPGVCEFETWVHIRSPDCFISVRISVGTVLIFQFNPGFGTISAPFQLQIRWNLKLWYWNLNWVEPKLLKIFGTKIQKLRFFWYFWF